MNINNYVLIFVELYLIQINTIFCVSCKSRNQNAESPVIKTVQMIGKEISYSQWSKKPNENVVLSPLSITIILNLLMLGSTGNTKEEFKKALNYSTDLPEEVIHENFKNILLSLSQSENEVEVSLTTGIFTRKDSKILSSYKNISENFYFTEIQNLDFRGSRTGTKERINCWISTNTKGKIMNEFSSTLNPNTVSIVYSVLFLNKAWENKFNTSLTRNGTFNTGKKNISIPMMTSDIKVSYLRNEEERFEMVAIPYEGKRYSMYILKPMDDEAKSKLINMEYSLNSEYLDSLISQMTTQKMSLAIPKMRLSQKLDLEIYFNSLGIKEIFEMGSADFEKFSDTQKLYVNNIYQRTILEVTEDGTRDTAGYLSENLSANLSGELPKSLAEKFIVDKPSLIFVRNNENGLIIIWAKVLQPEPLATLNEF